MAAPCSGDDDERGGSDGEKSVFMTFREQQSIEVARRRKKKDE